MGAPQVLHFLRSEGGGVWTPWCRERRKLGFGPLDLREEGWGLAALALREEEGLDPGDLS